MEMVSNFDKNNEAKEGKKIKKLHIYSYNTRKERKTKNDITHAIKNCLNSRILIKHLNEQ